MFFFLKVSNHHTVQSFPITVIIHEFLTVPAYLHGCWTVAVSTRFYHRRPTSRTARRRLPATPRQPMTQSFSPMGPRRRRGWWKAQGMAALMVGQFGIGKRLEQFRTYLNRSWTESEHLDFENEIWQKMSVFIGLMAWERPWRWCFCLRHGCAQVDTAPPMATPEATPEGTEANRSRGLDHHFGVGFGILGVPCGIITIIGVDMFTLFHVTWDKIGWPQWPITWMNKIQNSIIGILKFIYIYIYEYVINIYISWQ